MSSPASRRSTVLLLWIAATTIALDQATKAIALARLEEGESVPAIDGVLHWSLSRNPGAAFGLFRRLPVLFTVLAFGVTAVILWLAPRMRGRWNGVTYGLVLGGAVGNLVDRLARAPGPFRGHVIDFVDFRVWPTFNVADAAITVGAIMAAVAAFRSPPADEAEDGASPAAEPRADGPAP